MGTRMTETRVIAKVGLRAAGQSIDDLPAALRAQLLKQGLATEDGATAPARSAAQVRADIAAALKALAKTRGKKTADGRPTVRAIEARLGYNVDEAEVQYVYEQMTKEDQDNG